MTVARTAVTSDRAAVRVLGLLCAGFVLVGCGAGRSSVRTTGAADAARPRAPASPEARAILAKMNDRYASAKTYRDEGTYRDAFRDLDGSLKETRTGQFKTRWRAPDRMLFVLEEHDRPEVRAVWTSNGVARDLLEGRTTERESLDMALGAMQGVSHGVTGLVPRWLLDRGNRRYLTWGLRGRAGCGDNRECWHLEAPRDDGKGTISLFVDVDTFALRRFASHTKLGEGNAAFIADDELQLSPTFDEPIPDYELAFDPMLR